MTNQFIVGKAEIKIFWSLIKYIKTQKLLDLKKITGHLRISLMLRLNLYQTMKIG